MRYIIDQRHSFHNDMISDKAPGAGPSILENEEVELTPAVNMSVWDACTRSANDFTIYALVSVNSFNILQNLTKPTKNKKKYRQRTTFETDARPRDASESCKWDGIWVYVRVWVWGFVGVCKRGYQHIDRVCRCMWERGCECMSEWEPGGVSPASWGWQIRVHKVGGQLEIWIQLNMYMNWNITLALTTTLTTTTTTTTTTGGQ